MFVAHNYTIESFDIKYVNGVLTIKTKDGYYYNTPKINSIYSFPTREKFWVNIDIPFPLDGISVLYDGLVIEVRGYIGAGPSITADPLPIVEAFDEVWDEVVEMVQDELSTDDELDEFIDDVVDELEIELESDSNKNEWDENVGDFSESSDINSESNWDDKLNEISDNLDIESEEIRNG